MGLRGGDNLHFRQNFCSASDFFKFGNERKSNRVKSGRIRSNQGQFVAYSTNLTVATSKEGRALFNNIIIIINNYCYFSLTRAYTLKMQVTAFSKLFSRII